MNLAWKLALVEKGFATQDFLESYTHERLPVVASMLNQTTALLNKTFARTPDNFDGWKRGHELRQFGVNYRGSPIIVDETPLDETEAVDPYQSGNDDTVRGGDRAPDAAGLISVGKPTNKWSNTLFDVFGSTHHTLIVFSDDKEKQTEVLEAVKAYPETLLKTVVLLPQTTKATCSKLPASYVFKDKDGFAYDTYMMNARELDTVVVRPDGVIGALTNGAEGVKKYFDIIFTADAARLATSMQGLKV